MSTLAVRVLFPPILRVFWLEGLRDQGQEEDERKQEEYGDP
jgi:hypothetical protein